MLQPFFCLGRIFPFIFCHKAVLMLCKGLGTRTTWLGSKIQHSLAYSTCFGCHLSGGGVPALNEK